MNFTMNRVFSIFLILFLFLSFASSAANANQSGSSAKIEADATTQVICNIIGYVWGIGVPLMTIVIIGAAMLAIFGRMPWPALFALGVFCAVFFGAAGIIKKLTNYVGSTDSASLMDKCGREELK